MENTNMGSGGWLFPSERAALMRGSADARFQNGQTNQAVDCKQHNGPGPADALRLEFALPDVNSNQGVINLSDPITRQELEKIRKRCHAFLVLDSNAGYITICSRQIENIQAAVQALRDLLQSIAKDLVCRMLALAHRSTTASHSRVSLKKIEQVVGLGFKTGYRGVSKDPVSIEDPADVKESDVEKDDSLGPLTANEFSEAVQQAALRIRPIRGELFVRAHLGVFCSYSRENANGKAVKTYNSNRDFREFLSKSAARGTANVSHNLGGADLTLKVRDYICATQDKLSVADQRYQALDSRLEHLSDIKPKYCLVFFSRDRRIEVDVQYDTRDPRSPYTPAAPRVFAEYQKAAVVEIAVGCPEKICDWHLAVEADIGARGIPEAYQNLVKGLQFPKGRPKNDFDFPATAVSEALLRAAKIDNVACKVSWTFECRKTPYCVEVAVYHEWKDNSLSRHLYRRRTQPAPGQVVQINTANKKLKSTKGCGITLYGQGWDDEMQELNPVSGTFVPDFVHALAGHQDLVDFSSNFLREMECLLDNVAAAASGAAETEELKKS
ncbi:hypothetical protein M406DRAFT_70580 [Cryphonectria parasitica EP155]|uniref:DUF7905 domain-containing protein n=1 Tax=Cryphonectria parasitica (strain ATCC 38755 / EP155) TaxID=660469 RepID=A0A9P4Y1N6_CRYP1|nr:uncharacterized protein M406DRAFT_70580 [Cryphonectria parasitica EP155]KAF3764906.1 hypothetical protein M406DRAFT_70580 [Cryphonectria parasitica EP155]